MFSPVDLLAYRRIPLIYNPTWTTLRSAGEQSSYPTLVNSTLINVPRSTELPSQLDFNEFPSYGDERNIYFVIDLDKWRRRGINFLEKIHLDSVERDSERFNEAIERVTKVSIRKNDNEILRMHSPFITKDIDFKFPVAGHNTSKLVICLTLDRYSPDWKNYRLRFDFSYEICPVLQKTYIQSVLRQMNGLRETKLAEQDPQVYTVDLHTVIGKVTQIHVEIGFQIDDVYIDYEGKGEYDSDISKKSFCTDNWSFPEPYRCLLKYNEPVDFSKFKNPQLVFHLAKGDRHLELQTTKGELINYINETVFLEVTTLNAFSLRDGNVDLVYH